MLFARFHSKELRILLADLLPNRAHGPHWFANNEKSTCRLNFRFHGKYSEKKIKLSSQEHFQLLFAQFQEIWRRDVSSEECEGEECSVILQLCSTDTFGSIAGEIPGSVFVFQKDLEFIKIITYLGPVFALLE